MGAARELKTDFLLYAYSQGVFPMAPARDADTVEWFAPDPRAIIDVDRFSPGRHFRRLLRHHSFEIRINAAFRRVMEACAQPRPDDAETWISPALIDVYCGLHDIGFAHSVEAYAANELVGGLYAVQVGCALMGESMFSRVTDASKVCLLTLLSRMKARGFPLLDVQFLTPHLQRFGAIEVSRAEYERRLARAVRQRPVTPFDAPPLVLPPGIS